MDKEYYLVFAVDRIPDLTLTKYSVLDGSSVDDIIEKHGVFLRQLHRLGSTSGVYFHLLYYFDPDERIKKGHHLSVVFYATSADRRKLDGIREFLTTSVLSTYYDFHCYEVSSEFKPDIIIDNADDDNRLVNLNDIFTDDTSNNSHKQLSPVRGLLSLNKYVFGKAIRLVYYDNNSFLRVYIDEKNLDEDLGGNGDSRLYSDYPVVNKEGRLNLTYNLIMALDNGLKTESGEMFICYFDESGSVIEAIEKHRVQCVVNLKNVSGIEKRYGIGEKEIKLVTTSQIEINKGIRPALAFELASDGDAVLGYNGLRAYDNGRVLFMRKYVLAKKLQIINNQLWLFETEDEWSNSAAFEYNLDDAEVRLLENGVVAGNGAMYLCYFEGDSNVIVSVVNTPIPCDENGNIISIFDDMEKKFSCMAYLTKKDYYLPAQNRLENNVDREGEVRLYSIMDWEPCEDGRLYNVLKLMEGYKRTVALRIDIFPVEQTQLIREKMLPYANTRKRIAKHDQGKDDNSENIIKSWDKYLQNLMKFPQFLANVVAFADSKDIAVMLADSVAAEAVESGTYRIESDENKYGFSVYYGDNIPLNSVYWEKRDSKQLSEEDKNVWYKHIRMLLSLYTLEELRPMFSFPILYPGESIECLKETDPKPERQNKGAKMSLGISSLGYDVEFPIKNFVKHAFIAGVPGAGKTNTMLHLVTSLWRRNKEERVPFLVLEPAKQEYRALAKIEGMEELHIFSPGADTYFPLHINPFQFPVGLTLAEHIANLNAVFAGAFELPPPSPHFIDTCIEKVYLDKGWNVNERNTLDESGNYRHEFPTLQELYASLEAAVKNSHYQGETLGNLQSVLEVRVGSLLKREIGNVYNVRESILKPEEWLDVPAIIELESLGEGPANFMSLLISTLIRETLKVRKTSADESGEKKIKDLNHVIFYEEAHNLIGPDTDSPLGDSVDPKISATKFIVKMLAEVRALREGIVIADQLPTVMAAEVLKNTGLKIAHRITAQDDRNLLGSTMSASPDQLEEQGTFDTGWALIFYEGLLKPYKIRIHEWDSQNNDPEKYESPTNKQLFTHLRNNSIYQKSLQKSAQIMVEKMDVEYHQLFERAEKFKFNIDKDFLLIRAMERGIEKQEADLTVNDQLNDVTRAKIEIQKQKLAYEERKDAFIQKYSRELHMLCWDFGNQYFASITLAKNYDFASNQLYVKAISGYTSLFVYLKSLVDVPEFAKVLVNETTSVMSDMERFVSLDPDVSTILSESDHYKELQYSCGYYWVNEIYTRKIAMISKARRIIQTKKDRERNIIEFCNDWTKQFLFLYRKADTYATAVNLLIQDMKNRADSCYIDAPDIYESLMTEVAGLRNRKHALYKMLHSFVIGPIKEAFRFLHDADRVCFLKASKAIRQAHLEIVNYIDKTASTKLSSSERYGKLREEATVIANIELLARSEMARADRLLKTDELVACNSPQEKDRLIKVLRDTANAYFKFYRSYDVERYDYHVILVNFYLEFLDSMMDLGEVATRCLLDNDPTRLEIRMCNELVQKLKKNDLIMDDQKLSWIRIFDRWTRLSKEH